MVILFLLNGYQKYERTDGITKKQYARLQELTAIARQRYLDAGGNPKCCPSGLKGDDYMTDEERQESRELERQIFGVRVINDEVQCQGRTWKLSVATAKQG